MKLHASLLAYTLHLIDTWVFPMFFYGSMVQSLKSSETFFSFFFIKYFKVLNLGGYWFSELAVAGRNCKINFYKGFHSFKLLFR